MTRLRLIMIVCAALSAAAGVTAGAASLVLGTVDQAVAFTWPGVAASLALMLMAPSRPQD